MRELKCRFCSWESEGYSDDMLREIKRAKQHAKTHKLQWKFWSNQGKVLDEMFLVVSKESPEKRLAK